MEIQINDNITLTIRQPVVVISQLSYSIVVSIEEMDAIVEAYLKEKGQQVVDIIHLTYLEDNQRYYGENF